jgi:hypothetical protein
MKYDSNRLGLGFLTRSSAIILIYMDLEGLFGFSWTRGQLVSLVESSH